jgi:hypothetical protein
MLLGLYVHFAHRSPAEEALPSEVESGGRKLVNFAKWRALAKILHRLQALQRSSYIFTPVDVIQNFLRNVRSL